jgi:uroporphyrinogen-III synthase
MPARSLDGRTVVITRPTPGSLARRLEELGARVEHVPLIAVGPPGDGGAALAAALSDLDTYDWLVVTSANGAASVATAVAGHRHIRLAAVGAATAAALADAACRAVDLVPTRADSDGLLAAFPRKPGRVLLAQASLAGEHLATGLRALGHDVTAVEAYSTTPLPPSPAGLQTLRGADAVVLASGSAATAWAAAEGAGASPLATATAAIVTIGPKTATVAQRHGATIAAIAATPTDDAVAAAVAAALALR